MSACVCIKMTATLEAKPTYPGRATRQHDEYRFLHYLGKMNQVWTESTHVMISASSPAPLSEDGICIENIYTIADPLAVRLPFHGSLLWVSRNPSYGIVALDEYKKALTPYQFPFVPLPIRMSTKKLDELVHSWEEEPHRFEAFYQQKFAALQGSRLKREAVREEDKNLPVLDLDFILK